MTDSSNPKLPVVIKFDDYSKVLKKYKVFLITTIITCTVLFIGYTFIMPQTFSSGASLLPPEKTDGFSFASLLAKGAQNLDFKAFAENSSSEVFVKILTSRTVADSIIRKFSLLKLFNMNNDEYQQAIDKVQGMMVAESDRQGMIQLSFNPKTGYFSDKKEQEQIAKLSADVVNYSIIILDKLNRTKTASKAKRSKEFIGKLKIEKRFKLDSIQSEYLKFQQKNKALALDKQVASSIEALSEVQSAIFKKELEITSAKLDLSSDSKFMEMLNKQLVELKKQKVEVESGRAGGDVGIAFTSVPELTKRFANLKIDLEVSTQIYNYLEAQYQQESIQEARDMPTVSVLDPAAVPELRSSPRRSLLTPIAFVIISLVSVLLAFWHNSFEQKSSDH